MSFVLKKPFSPKNNDITKKKGQLQSKKRS